MFLVIRFGCRLRLPWLRPVAAEAIPWKVMQLADARSVVNKEKGCQMNPAYSIKWTLWA
jgi:hypothetical protein